MTPFDGFGAYFEDPANYQEMGQDAPEPDDVRDGDGLCTFCGEWYCAPDCKPWPQRDPRDEPDLPQGGEHYIEVEMREERDG